VLDLTGGNLIAYIRRIIEDAVSRSPRFRETLGEVTTPYNNLIQWKDAQVSIKDVSSAGNRLSPDYFMTKQYGRAILAKVEHHDGSFVEWLQETDRTKLTPVAGTYYFNVDSVDERDNRVVMTMQQFRWEEGKVTNAQGSLVYLAPGIDGTTLSGYVEGRGSPPAPLVTAVNDGSFPSVTGSPPVPVDLLLSPRVGYLLTPTPAGLTLYAGSPAAPLAPLADYWYQQEASQVIVASTIGGSEVANIPQGTVPIPGSSPPQEASTLVSFSLVDQTGYELRLGKDYTWYASNDWVELSEWTPAGMTITANMVVKANPLEAPGTNPEDILQAGVGPGESLAEGQVFIHTAYGDYYSATVGSDGTITLPRLLLPGEWCLWEVRILTAQEEREGRKYRTNEQLIPGLRIAIGDNVVVGDQVAIIVSPETCETYEVYGSKENIDFTLDVRSNDLQTSSDLSEMLKQQLLVMRREDMEADGVTVFEARRSYQGMQRDLSGTAPQYVYSVSITAMCDWKVYVPLVTRLVRLEITSTALAPGYGPAVTPAPIGRAFGVTGFVQSYS
jgi:hypothetical protein